MKTFLHNLMGNEAFKDRLVQHMQRVLPILSEPESSIIPQLKINRDLVEVQGGWFWSFSAGPFVHGDSFRIAGEGGINTNNLRV